MSQTNWFELANTYPLKPFLESAYGLEFRKNACLCPFHADSNPSLNIVMKKEVDYFHCVVCGAGGDITKFVERYEHMQPIDAVKKVLLFHGVEVGKTLTAEEQAKADEAQRERVALLKKEGAKKEKVLATKKAKVIKELTTLSQKLVDNLYEAFQNANAPVIDEVESRFPHIYNNTEVRDAYLGYDYDHESLVIINRQLNDGKTFNIKYYREKDKSGGYKPGKWISRYDSTTAVFGLDFLQKEGPVFVCEGEKDVINLLLLGCNALTLGGVSNSWDDYKEVLKDRDVIVWFDNDKAGYVNAVIKSKEIAEVANTCRAVMFYYLGNFSSKYDVSDFVSEYELTSVQGVMDAIAYSSFVMHNGLINEIVQRYDWSDKEQWMVKKLLELCDTEVIKDFDTCGKEVLKFVKNVRGEKEEEAKLITHLCKQLKDTNAKEALQKMINSLFPEDSVFLGAELAHFERIINFKKTLLTQYVQTHIRDMVTELLSAVKSAGFEFATHRQVLYLWTGNYYYAVQNWEIESFILQQFFQAAKVDFKKQTVKTRNEVIENVYGWANPLEKYIDTKKRVMNMLNGTLIIHESGKFTFRNYHKKSDCAMNMLQANYDENAKAHKWDKFLKRVVPEPGDRDAIEEFIGYCLLPSHKYESFLYLYGASGANGKSVILEIMRSFFSRENVSSVELHDFEGHKINSLVNKVLNIGSEVNSGGDMRKAVSILKALTSTHDTVNVDPKNKDGFVLYPEEKPKCAFAANKKFKSGADDGGLMRRAIFISFDEEIRDDEKIRDLVERFEDEKAGILNVALRGLTRLVKNGKFTMSEKRAEFMKEYRKEVSPVRAYLEDNLVENAGLCTPKQLIYQHYKAWCEEMGNQVYASPTFWQKVNEVQKMEEKRPTARQFVSSIYGSRPRFIQGWAIESELIDEIKIGDDEIDVNKEKFSTIGFTKVSYE